MFSILLYYCYTPIDDPENFRKEHHLYCLSLNLKGRIIIAKEGINGTVSGIKENCEKYMQFLKSDARFKNIEFKIDEHQGHVFKKLNARVKPELVSLGFPELDPNKKTGVYLEPNEFKRLIHSPPLPPSPPKSPQRGDFPTPLPKGKGDSKSDGKVPPSGGFRGAGRGAVVVLDVRNNVEHKIGKFKNAVTLNIDHFRDFTSKVKELERYKNCRILTYCTGGIRCEKASAYLIQQGFKDVYQLHGGIINYGYKEGGKDFDGSCYVFDSRIAVDVNKVNPVVISRCYICDSTCDRMVNCANPECNLHVPICCKCSEDYEGACSKACMVDPKKRTYNGNGYYQKRYSPG